jgi:molybdenum cofactor synthesis domain-containing protein
MSGPVSTRGDDLDRLRLPAEARAIVLSHCRRLPSERVPLAEAAWRTAANDMVSPEDHPPFPASTMDGYAVISDDGSPWREVIGVQTAGELLEIEITPGTTARITTGAPVPRGADAVVKVENTELADDHVIIHQDHVKPGENIRPVGVDIARGGLVLPAGSQLGPAEIGVAAGLGFDPIDVVRRPRVSVLSTGDELVDPGQPLGPGQIRDSNRFSLQAALAAEDVDLVWSGKAPDDRDALTRRLQSAIAESDLVVTSGGVSMGELDLIKAILGGLATVHFRRLYMKPGKPLNFATAGETLIFGLPGNPVSALVGFELFIRPALLTLLGRQTVERPRIRVTLTEPTPPTDRIDFQRAMVSLDADGRLVGRPNGVQASSRLGSLIGANALLVIPPREFAYEPGETVDALLIGPILSPQSGFPN